MTLRRNVIYGVGRGCGVGRGRGVTLGVALGVTLGVAVGVTLGVTVGVALGVTLGVGVGLPPGQLPLTLYTQCESGKSMSPTGTGSGVPQSTALM